MKFTTHTQSIEYMPALDYFKQFSEDVPGFLFESVDTAPIYGRVSMMGIDPAVEVVGRGDTFTIRALNQYGKVLLSYVSAELFSYAEDLVVSTDEITGRVPNSLNQNPDQEPDQGPGQEADQGPVQGPEQLDESTRQQQKNSATIIRTVLEVFQNQDSQFGLYGAFSYDFVRLFENLPDRHAVTNHTATDNEHQALNQDSNQESNQAPDFHLYIPDILYQFDHMKETAEIVYYNFAQVDMKDRLTDIPRGTMQTNYAVGELHADIDQSSYEQSVAQAQEYMKQGDIFELVLSRRFSASFSGSSVGVYERYRQANPSPYMFYVRYSDRVLLGASPEMFVRVENDTVMTRPISGTAVRSQDPIEDYEHMLELLNSPKEKSELDMLIDLARNDLSRVCLPGVAVTEYRYVEKYSKVMHTVAQVEGQLDTQHYTAFDAFIACLNAGTLTGAPKIRAMELIDEIEPSRRGFYGGSVGYLTCHNELNTGIIIRAAEITRSTENDASDKNDHSEQSKIILQAGASIVYDSSPTAEYTETENKAAALIQVLQ